MRPADFNGVANRLPSGPFEKQAAI